MLIELNLIEQNLHSDKKKMPVGTEESIPGCYKAAK